MSINLKNYEGHTPELLVEIVRLRAENEELKRALYFSSALIKLFAAAGYRNEGTAKSVKLQLEWNERIATELEDSND